MKEVFSMGKHLAAFYSADDNLEHALLLSFESPPPNPFFMVSDATFSPETQGHRRIVQRGVALPVAITGAYSPIDGLRYAFFATPDNQVFVSTYTQEVYGFKFSFSP